MNEPKICSKCDKQFLDPMDYRRHQKCHSEPTVCDICGIMFQRASGLQTHIKHVHKDIRPFICEYCSAKFKRKSVLQRHFTVHFGGRKAEKVLLCNIDGCTMTYSRKQTLNDHQFRRHGTINQTNEILVQCLYCALTFSNYEEMQSHRMANHQNECIPKRVKTKRSKAKNQLKKGLDFQCEICKQYFLSELVLMSHSLLHKNKNRPFKCDVRKIFI